MAAVANMTGDQCARIRAAGRLKKPRAQNENVRITQSSLEMLRDGSMVEQRSCQPGTSAFDRGGRLASDLGRWSNSQLMRVHAGPISVGILRCRTACRL